MCLRLRVVLRRALKLERELSYEGKRTPKKITSHVRLSTWKNIDVKRSIYKPIHPRLLVNLLVKLTRVNPLGLRGGHGGAYPREPSRGCISPPQQGGAMGCPRQLAWSRTEVGFMGLAQGPRGPWPPFGEIHSREGSQGVNVYLGVP